MRVACGVACFVGADGKPRIVSAGGHEACFVGADGKPRIVKRV